MGYKKYAKTLFKPERPNYANEIIRKYTKAKVPFFFQYAKGKDKEKCEPKGTNIIDRIGTNITTNINMFNKVKNLSSVNYLLLLKDKKDLGENKELNKVFDKHNKHYGFNLKVDNKDKRNNNINAICTQVYDDLKEIEPDEDKIISSITHLLYKKPSTRKKKLYWMMFGEQIYNNLLENIKDLPQNVCKKCGKRTDKKLIDNICEDCRKKEIKENNGKKKIICIDCGKEFWVDKSSRSKRCEDCKKQKQLEWDKEYRRKRRKLEKVE